jgi:hypothetical protein
VLFFHTLVDISLSECEHEHITYGTQVPWMAQPPPVMRLIARLSRGTSPNQVDPPETQGLEECGSAL